MNELGSITPRFDSSVLDSYKRCYLRRKGDPERHERDILRKRDEKRKVPFVVNPDWGKCL